MMASLTLLPQDIFHQILQYVRVKYTREYVNPEKYLVDCQTLSNLSKASKGLCAVIQPELFRSLRVRSSLSSALNLVRILISRPDLAQNVDCLSSDEEYFDYTTPSVSKQANWVITPEEASEMNDLFEKYSLEIYKDASPTPESADERKLKPLSINNAKRRKRPNIDYCDLFTLALLQCRNIRQLKLYNTGQTFSYSAEPGFTFPNLTELFLYTHSSNEERQLEESLGWFLQAAPALRRIQACAVWKMDSGVLSHTSLNELSLEYCCIEAKTLRDITIAFPKLQRFLYRADNPPYHVTDFDDITPHKVVLGLLPLKDTLSWLRLEFQFAGAWEIELWTDEDSTLRDIRELTNLTELELGCYGLIRSAPPIRVEGGHILKRGFQGLFGAIASPSLKRLKLWDMEKVSELANVVDVVRLLFPNLEELLVRREIDDSDDEVIGQLPELFAKHDVRLRYFQDEDD